MDEASLKAGEAADLIIYRVLKTLLDYILSRLRKTF